MRTSLLIAVLAVLCHPGWTFLHSRPLIGLASLKSVSISSPQPIQSLIEKRRLPAFDLIPLDNAIIHHSRRLAPWFMKRSMAKRDLDEAEDAYDSEDSESDSDSDDDEDDYDKDAYDEDEYDGDEYDEEDYDEDEYDEDEYDEDEYDEEDYDEEDYDEDAYDEDEYDEDDDGDEDNDVTGVSDRSVDQHFQQLQAASAPLVEYKPLLATIIDNELNEPDILIQLTTKFCRTGDIESATRGIEYLQTLLQTNKIRDIPLKTAIPLINAFASNGHENKVAFLIAASRRNPQFAEPMLYPGPIIRHLIGNAPSTDWEPSFQTLMQNIATCCVSDLNQVIRWLGRRRHLKRALELVDAMVEAKVAPNDETFEFIATAAVLSVEKVASAKTMKGLPNADSKLPEVVFAGRSNVGKSSLVNMLVNRKALASTSKIPGHTRSFNFYAVNRNRPNVPNVQLVDVPGLGYTQDSPVGDTVSWRSMLERYLTVRASCRVLFHLIDCRTRFEKADVDIMNIALRALAVRQDNGTEPFHYVVALTKADKLKERQVASASSLIRDYLTNQTLLSQSLVGSIPILVTSAKSKVGRNKLWHYFMKTFASPDSIQSTAGGLATTTHPT